MDNGGNTYTFSSIFPSQTMPKRVGKFDFVAYQTPFPYEHCD
jgi:hypothetical protein